MQTIVIATTANVTIEQFIDMIPDSYKIERQADRRFYIFSNTHHCWIEYDDKIELDYEEDELKIIKKYIPNPLFYTCEFTDIEFGKKILSYILFDDKFVIDNDYGDILTGSEFKKKLKDEPDWDWRVSSAPWTNGP